MTWAWLMKSLGIRDQLSLLSLLTLPCLPSAPEVGGGVGWKFETSNPVWVLQRSVTPLKPTGACQLPVSSFA